jgi:hypothetical protein
LFFRSGSFFFSNWVGGFPLTWHEKKIKHIKQKKREKRAPLAKNASLQRLDPARAFAGALAFAWFLATPRQQKPRGQKIGRERK